MAEQKDIVERLRERNTLRYMGNCKCGRCQLVPVEMICEAADEIERLRKQSRGHFDAMTAVLRDGIKAVTPPEFHDQLPDPKPPSRN